MHCPLCSCGEVQFHQALVRRDCFVCTQCSLIFVAGQYHISIDDERRRYDLHDNTVDNGGYVRFLSQVVHEVGRHHPAGAAVLDYGCGKNAVLTKLFNNAGYRCDPYDPLYNYPLCPDRQGTYDVIVLCEVVEHCRDLAPVLSDIKRYLHHHGMVLIRTRTYPHGGDLSGWWYGQDITHINFFSKRTLEYVARQIHRVLEERVGDDLFLMLSSST